MSCLLGAILVGKQWCLFGTLEFRHPTEEVLSPNLGLRLNHNFELGPTLTQRRAGVRVSTGRTAPGNPGNPANTIHSPNAALTLGQRRRRWSNVKTVLGECIVFAGMFVIEFQCRHSVMTSCQQVNSLQTRTDSRPASTNKEVGVGK